MKTKTKYVDEISGLEFDTKEKAEKSESKHLNLKKVFNFYKPPKDKDCKFANGEYCYQRTREFYEAFETALFLAIKKYEPWIVKSYEKEGKQFTKKYLRTYYVGRCLDDGDSSLYRWLIIFLGICPKCFREYGQTYYSMNCKHNNSIQTRLYQRGA